MKQWIYKVTTPRNKRGSIADIETNHQFYAFGCVYLDGEWVKPEYYLDIFEEIEVKSDEDLIAQKLNYLWRQIPQSQVDMNVWKLISKDLLFENAFNPEWLKKLRGE